MNRLSIIEKALFLKKCELFSGLDLDIILAIAEKAESRLFHDKEVVFQQDQEAHRLFIVIKGEVSIFSEHSPHLASLKPFDFFGEEALLSQTTRSYSASAEKATELLAISRSHLDEILLECPQVALALIKSFADVTPFRKRVKTVQ